MRNKDTQRFRYLIVGCACLMPLSIRAEGHINASLKVVDPMNPGANIILTLTNTGDAPITFMEWETPFPESGGRLARSLFKITDESGREIAYRGTWVYIGGLTMNSFRSIAPGEVLSKQVDLAPEYRFEPNHIYTVEYELNLTHEPDPNFASSAERAFFVKPAQQRAIANPVTVFFNDAVTRRTQSQSGDDEHKCLAVQKLTITRAQLEAHRRVFAGESFMMDRYDSYLANGQMKYRFIPHPRYTRWFGAHDDSEPEFNSDDWGSNDNARAYETVMATARRVSEDGFTPRCGCPGFQPDTAAHAETDNPYVMHFCDRFFKLPEFDTYASRSGAILHEYTHFNTYYQGTSDYGYGHSFAQKIAKEDRPKAVRNADNFEFFFTDTTPYGD